jgi:hypothetical protein
MVKAAAVARLKGAQAARAANAPAAGAGAGGKKERVPTGKRRAQKMIYMSEVEASYHSLNMVCCVAH